MCLNYASAAVCAIVCLAATSAGAASSLSFVDEIRGGLSQHDTGIVGDHKEAGSGFRPRTAVA